MGRRVAGCATRRKAPALYGKNPWPAGNNAPAEPFGLPLAVREASPDETTATWFTTRRG